jgi:hypothetical protein
MAKEIKYPKGFPYKVGFTKIAVAFPDKQFKDILKMAMAEHKEFNEMVIELCKVGKLDLDESDKLEPRKEPHDRVHP